MNLSVEVIGLELVNGGLEDGFLVVTRVIFSPCFS